MKRYLEKYILRDLKKKIVLLSGPRQTGKTTLSKMLMTGYDYFNYDSSEDRLGLIEKSWDRSKDLIIFDELHKLKNWKSWLKGIYDTEGVPPAIIVTGSARLDSYRKAGDSLAGRFFQFRLHPLDLKEIKNIIKPKNLDAELDKLLNIGGFPEPFLDGNLLFYNRWTRIMPPGSSAETVLPIILRQSSGDSPWRIWDIHAASYLPLIFSAV